MKQHLHQLNQPQKYHRSKLLDLNCQYLLHSSFMLSQKVKKEHLLRMFSALLKNLCLVKQIDCL